MVFRLELQEEFEVLSRRNTKERRQTGKEAGPAQKAPRDGRAGQRAWASRPGGLRAPGPRARSRVPAATSLPSRASPTPVLSSAERGHFSPSTLGVLTVIYLPIHPLCFHFYFFFF